MISCVAAFWLVLTYDLLEKRRINDVPINDILFFIFDDIYKKKTHSMLPSACFVLKDRRSRQNRVKTSVAHSATFLFQPHFEVISQYY